MSGHKNDAGKAPIHLIPGEFIFAVSRILEHGVKEYGAWNWARGMAWSRVFSALMRHMWAWWSGKGPTSKSFLFGETDPDTKCSHLWHAACCILFLICYEEWGMTEWDDRFTPPEGK